MKFTDMSYVGNIMEDHWIIYSLKCLSRKVGRLPTDLLLGEVVLKMPMDVLALSFNQTT